MLSEPVEVGGSFNDVLDGIENHLFGGSPGLNSLQQYVSCLFPEVCRLPVWTLIPQ